MALFVSPTYKAHQQIEAEIIMNEIVWKKNPFGI